MPSVVPPPPRPRPRSRIPDFQDISHPITQHKTDDYFPTPTLSFDPSLKHRAGNHTGRSNSNISSVNASGGISNNSNRRSVAGPNGSGSAADLAQTSMPSPADFSPEINPYHSNYLHYPASAATASPVARAGGIQVGETVRFKGGGDSESSSARSKEGSERKERKGGESGNAVAQVRENLRRSVCMSVTYLYLVGWLMD